MAPIKRPRAVLDEGETPIVAVESAQSNLRQNSRKKARLLGEPRRNHTLSAEDYDSHEDVAASDTDGVATRRDAAGSVSDLDDSSDEELDRQIATQLSSKRRESVVNRPADHGVIETVSCSNFMCHAQLEVALGPLINFIIGHNGSGKSAVLTALTLCLGGKASATNRGQSLKSFIKEGQELCTLAVKLKNTAESAYQHEVYGDSIIIERHFSRAGTSGFRLKSATGRLISTRKADLEEICDYYALQLDNPMNCLTQDMARQFLNNSSEQEKYKFFVKGVQLEQLDQDYQLIEDYVDAIENTLGTRMQDVEVLKKKKQDADSKFRTAEKHDSLRQKLRNLANQMAWAQVEEQERNLESFAKQMQKAGKIIDDAESEAVAADTAFTEAVRKLEVASEAVQEAQGGVEPLRETKQQTKDEFDQVRGEALDVQKQQRVIADHLRAAELRIENTKIEIADEYTKLDAANGGSHTRRLAEKDEKQSKVAEAQNRLKEHTSSFSMLETDRKSAEQELDQIKVPIQAKRNEVRQCEEQLNNLRRDRGQQQGGFHPNMPRLLRAIQQEAGFQEKPIGPVGSHVRLLQPSWSTILEKSFGGMLESFVVMSKSDQALLSNLMKRVGCNCQILIGNHRSIDTSQHEPDSNFTTTLRVLEVDNDAVRRQLIINQVVEQTLLIEDRSQAIAKMYDHGRLRNVKQCFSMNDQRNGWGVRLAYGWQGAENISPMPPFQGKPRMKTDIESQISYQQDLLQRLKQDLAEIVQRQQHLQSDVIKCNEAISQYKKRQQSLRLELQAAQKVVEDLQDALDKDRVEEGRLDALKDNLKEVEDEKRLLEGSYEEAVTSADKHRESMKTLTGRLRIMDAQLADGEARIHKAEARELKLKENRQLALLAKNKAIQSIADLKEEEKRLEIQRDRLADRVAHYIEQACQVCVRVPVEPGETGQTLEAKLKKLSADLERHEKALGSNKARFAAEASEATTIYETALRQVQSFEQLAQLLKSTLVTRRMRWKKFRSHIAARAKAQFVYLLSERGFRGKLKTDHKQKLLEIKVEPDETQMSHGRQTKTLSGGEKSFSTICLLLSLWEAMGAPIRCLDEFDVFMDSVNREVSMNMIIVAARRSVGRQFILITPQSMGSVDVTNPDVRVIKLNDPERGQTTLPYAGREAA
ncbi:MAG: DNA repair Rad18 [Lasallia pustulata]|uniref:DNA repair Rad18 n=1 Tax=Lasallia pustulata TaxID=136370 RepID=A0A5M8PI39_9LECA|nr:MAG: DNA repair Rad18 [Lasallia pustulata]